MTCSIALFGNSRARPQVLSFLSRVDFRVIAALEEKIRHGNHVLQIGDLVRTLALLRQQLN